MGGWTKSRGSQDLDFGPEISLGHLMSQAEKKVRYTSLEFSGVILAEKNKFRSRQLQAVFKAMSLG